MIEYLQPALRDSKVFKELYRAQDNELQLTQVALDDLADQLDIDKATWALDIYEKERQKESELNPFPEQPLFHLRPKTR